MAVARRQVGDAAFCYQCGAPTDPSSVRAGACGYCSAPLVPLHHPDPRKSAPCPRCTAAVSLGSQYCSCCGARTDAQQAMRPGEHACPGCGSHELQVWPVEHPREMLSVTQCASCGGQFVDHTTLRALIEQEQQRFACSFDADSPSLNKVERFELKLDSTIKYRACPACGERMARKNFGGLSGVLIDQCRNHGAYFDAGELAQVLAFVRSGGLEVGRARRAKQAKRDQRVRTESRLALARSEAREARGRHWIADVFWGDGLLGTLVYWIWRRLF